MLTVGDTLPEFNLTGVSGKTPDSFAPVTDKSYEGKWKILFFWPKDFTFVCPTEIVGYGELNGEFEDRDAVLLGCSTDTDFVHAAWRTHHEDLGDSPFVWLADEKKRTVSSPWCSGERCRCCPACDLHRRSGQHHPSRPG